MLKITSKQADKVHRLVKECCANCDKDGNCILLDDGEAHRCVQLISIYGIYCNYFKNAVLLKLGISFDAEKKLITGISVVTPSLVYLRSLSALSKLLSTP